MHKFGEETSFKPFFKKSKFSISLDRQFEVSYSFFVKCQNRGLPKYIETTYWLLTFNSNKFFLKNKRDLELASFPAWFLKKNISHVMFY